MGISLTREDIERLAGPVADGQMSLLSRYAEAIRESAGRMNLLSRRSVACLEEHVLDSAALLSFTDVEGREVGDLGSGAGLPGVVVAILRESARVTLIDSRRSKVVFLKRVKRVLELENVRIVHARLEELTETESFDIAAVRALERGAAMLPVCLRLVSPGGRLVLFKGPKWAEEREGMCRTARQEGFAVGRTKDVEVGSSGRVTTFIEFHVKRNGEVDRV